MSYRDDRDADQARITALESDLAAANKRVAELEGSRSLALVPTSGNALAVTKGEQLPWYGAPLRLELTRTFDGAFPVALFEDLIDTIRSHTHETGRTEILRSSMTWSRETNPKGVGPFQVVTVTSRDNRTTLVVTDKLGQAAGALYGGIGGGVGGGGLSIPLGIAMGALSMPLLAPVLALGWLGLTFVGTRALFKRLGRRRAAALQSLFDALADDIQQRLAAVAKGDPAA